MKWRWGSLHTVLEHFSWEKVHKLKVKYAHKVMELGFRFLPSFITVRIPWHVIFISFRSDPSPFLSTLCSYNCSCREICTYMVQQIRVSPHLWQMQNHGGCVEYY
jgi:hypothetical protein